MTDRLLTGMQRIWQEKKNLVISLGFTALWWVILAIFGDFTYDLNDDVMLQDLLSGHFTGTPTGYCVYILYPLAFVIALFYRILPFVHWFAFLLLGSIFVCQVLLTARIGRMLTGKYHVVAMIGWVLLWTSITLYRSIFVQYSVVAAVLAATGAFLFLTSDQEKNGLLLLRENWGSIMLVALGFMLRSQMVLLLLPMFAVVGLIKWSFHASVEANVAKAAPAKVTAAQSNAAKANAAKAAPAKANAAKAGQSPSFLRTFFSWKIASGFLFYIAALVAALGVSYGIHLLAYSSVDWKTYTRFNAARTELYDYQRYVSPYGDQPAFYDANGISPQEVGLLKNYNMTLDDALSAEKLEALVSFNLETLQIPHYQYDFRAVLPVYKYRVTHEVDQPWIFYIWVLYLLCILSVTDCGRLGTYLALPLLFGARSIGWIYPIMRGRMETRVSDSLYLAEILILFGLLLLLWSKPGMSLAQVWDQRQNDKPNLTKRERVDEREQNEKKRLRHFAQNFLILGLTCMLSLWLNATLTMQERELRRNTNAQWETMQAYFDANSDQFFAVDVYSTVSYSEKMFGTKATGYRNYDICGGWSSHSPVSVKKWQKLTGEPNPGQVLLTENARYVVRNDFYVDYLTDLYASLGINITLEQTDCIPVTEDLQFLIFRLAEKTDEAQCTME